MVRAGRAGTRATLAISTEFARLYRDCYARPPWSETPAQLAAHPEKPAAATRREGFTAWAARHGGGLTGICYGWPTTADLSGNHVSTMLVRAAGAEGAAALPRGAFEPAELFVHRHTSAAGWDGRCSPGPSQAGTPPG